jgi:putative ABC transport system permease protein
LGQQVRQIGVMKAVGARTGQLLAMYLTLVLIFGLLALAVALPLGILISHSAGGGVSSMLNYNSGPARNSTQGFILQLIVALVIPLAATLLPVLHGTRISVREAISSYGLGQGTFGKGLIDRLVESIRVLPRPLLISLRNTFRRKARLALTLSTLVLAGAIFMSVFHLRAALKNAIDETLGYVLTDVNVGFARTYRLEKVLPIAMNIPGVVDAEAWGSYIASVLKPGSGVGTESESGTQVQLLSPPSSSKLIKPTLSSGRWLLPGDQDALVISNHLIAVRPELKVGQTITLDIQGKKSNWTIVGIYRMVGNTSTPIVYANNDYLQQLINATNQVNSLRVVTTQHDAATQKWVAQALDMLYKESGIEVTTTTLGTEIVAANIAQTDVLVYFLLIMAILIAVVGGLGLASTMSMNVFERIREVGVMRAIGASNHDILWMVIVEGLLIGVISWVLAIALSIPIGSGLANILGTSMLQSPMKFVFSMDGVWIWLILVLVISGLASAMPARGAARMTIREVLAYE